MSQSDDPFLALADELYGLAPAEFTPARNDYAKQLRADGDRELSDRVKALRKPAAAAWVVNMLVRHHGEEMSQVLDLGESLRQAQTDLDGDALRELARQRRRLISAVAGKGRVLAVELGNKVSESVQRQVEETLHAAMIDTDAAAAVRSGLLVDPLTATGVGSLKVATAVAEHTALGHAARPLTEVAGPAGSRSGSRSGSSGLSVVPDEDPEEKAREARKAERAEATKAVRSAEADLDAARRTLADREKRASDLQASAFQVNGEIDELKRRIDELENRLERLDEQAEEAAEERDAAADQVAVTEAALASARAELDSLTD